MAGPPPEKQLPAPMTMGRPRNFKIEILANFSCWIFYNGEHIGDCHNPYHFYRFVSLIPRFQKCPVITIKAMAAKNTGYLLGKVKANNKTLLSGSEWKVASNVGKDWMSTSYPAKEFSSPSTKTNSGYFSKAAKHFMQKTGAKPVWLSNFAPQQTAFFRIPVPGCP